MNTDPTGSAQGASARASPSPRRTSAGSTSSRRSRRARSTPRRTSRTTAAAAPLNGRLYLVYTDETVNENNDTEIRVRRSDDSGTTWSASLRVNDDAVGPVRSQFLPRLAVDQSTGNVGVTWHDARNDGGVPGSGSTNAVPNDDAMYYGTVSNDGAATFAPNVQISDGVSNAAAAGSPLDYGDFSWCDFAGGNLQAAWADNSNSTGDNPDGTLHAFDVYSARIKVGAPTAVTTTSRSPSGAARAAPSSCAGARRRRRTCSASPLLRNGTRIGSVVPPAAARTAPRTHSPTAGPAGTAAHLRAPRAPRRRILLRRRPGRVARR